MLRPRLYLLIAFCALNLQAAPITFFAEDLNGNSMNRIPFPNAAGARANFLAALPGSATDTFEEFSSGALLPLTLTFSGANSATLNGSVGSVQSVPTGTNGFGRFPTSGNNYLETNAAALTFTFASPVSSFGFYAVDAGNFGGQLSLFLTRPDGGTVTVPVQNQIGSGARSPQTGSVVFFGYIDTATSFTNIQLLDSTATDSYGLDDVTIGTRVSAVPEPSSALTLGLGLVGLVTVLRKAVISSTIN